MKYLKDIKNIIFFYSQSQTEIELKIQILNSFKSNLIENFNIKKNYSPSRETNDFFQCFIRNGYEITHRIDNFQIRLMDDRLKSTLWFLIGLLSL